MYERKTVPVENIAEQLAICGRIREEAEASGAERLALVDTYGCPFIDEIF